MSSMGLKRTGKQIKVTSLLPRRPGRPKGTHRRSTSVMRVPDALIKKCRDALIEAKLANRDVSDADAVRMLAELGAQDVSGNLTVMNAETRAQFVRETKEQAIRETEEQAIRFATHRAVEAVCRLLGVEAIYNPATNEMVLTITRPIQPGEFTLPEDTLPPQPADVRH